MPPKTTDKQGRKYRRAKRPRFRGNKYVKIKAPVDSSRFGSVNQDQVCAQQMSGSDRDFHLPSTATQTEMDHGCAQQEVPTFVGDVVNTENFFMEAETSQIRQEQVTQSDNMSLHDGTSSVIETQTETFHSSDFDPMTHSTPNSTPIFPHGRRLVHLTTFLDQMKYLNEHPGPFNCNFSNMNLVTEKRVGLVSKLVFRCAMCCLERTVTTDNGPKMDVNTSSVVGALAIGVGHSQTEELMAALDVPFLSGRLYRKIEAQVATDLHHLATNLMEEAAKKEAELAIELGEVDEQGTPLITVIADGSWAKRSYKTKYDSLSGTAAIIGARTKQVLFLGVKNKYCTICCRAEMKNVPPKDHKCYRNWSGASTSMESAIILEGFRSSVSMYGIKYNRIIGDGDSSVYFNLLRKRPYGELPIEKVECTNHLLRNYARKLKAVADNKHAGPSNLRTILNSKVVSLRGAAKAASIHWNKSAAAMDNNISNLYAYVLNSPRHVLGDHQYCAAYFCTGVKEGEQNVVPLFQETSLWDTIMEVVDSLARQSKSLILRCTSNAVEGFNNIIAKLIGGKRINFCARGSYAARCMGAVVSHNSRAPLSAIHNHMAKKSPGVFVKKLERQRSRKIAAKLANPVPSRKRLFTTSGIPDKDYGPLATAPDLQPHEFEAAKERYLSRLQLTAEQRINLERKTVEQSSCSQWREERRKRLTASKYGQICKRRPTTKCENVVKELIYKPPVTTKAMSYGRFTEKTAITVFENVQGVKVQPCGLVIHPSLPYLAASPDGLVGEDALVEVKCPYTCRDMAPAEVVQSRKFPFLYSSESGTEVNRNHNYFYQVKSAQ